MSIDGDSGTATPAVHNIDILGGTGISTVGSGNDITINCDLTDTTYTAGDGLDLTGTVFSLENATTSNVGGSELATIAEVQAGTSETKTITPNSLFEVLPPVGAVIAWLKSFTNTPATLPTGWVECDGSTLSDADSVYNGQTLPDLNGGEFLRGNSTSGGTGGSTNHNHGVNIGVSGGELVFAENNDSGQFTTAKKTASSTTYESDEYRSETTTISNLPPYYDMVWIMRIK